MDHSNSPSISKILIEARQGNTAAKERIATWLMDEVQAKVLSVLKLDRPSTTQSSLMSNVLLKLVRGDTIQRAPSVFYLHAAIAKATREIVIDLWRQQQRRKQKYPDVVARNEGLFRRFDEMDWDVIELIEALDLLETIDPRKAFVVTARFFCGMTMDEIAEQFGVSKSTVEADWAVARAWLYEKVRKDL